MQTLIVETLEDLSFSGLLSHNGTWNISLINELLLSNDAKVIFRTSLFVIHCNIRESV